MTVIDPQQDSRISSRKVEKKIATEPANKKVRIVFNGQTIAESDKALIYHETGVGSLYYVPRSSVREELLTQTDHTTYCPYKGDARYWTIKVGDKEAENAMWAYPEIYDDYSPEIDNWVSFYTTKVNQYVYENEPFTEIRQAAE